jgi:hypothetical protein
MGGMLKALGKTLLLITTLLILGVAGFFLGIPQSILGILFLLTLLSYFVIILRKGAGEFDTSAMFLAAFFISVLAATIVHLVLGINAWAVYFVMLLITTVVIHLLRTRSRPATPKPKAK